MIANLPLLIAAAILLVVLGVGLFTAAGIQEGRRKRMARRLAGARQRQAKGGPKGTSEWLARVADRGQSLDRILDDPEETTVLLAQAGWRGVRARAAFYGMQVLMPIIGLAAAVPLWFVLVPQFGALVVAVLLVFLVLLAAALPRLVLRSSAKNRRERIRAEVPLFINLMMLLYEAGLSTRQALTSLVQDGEGTLPEMIDELAPVLRQVEAGADMSQLLMETSKTLAVPELESVLGVLRQVERYGGEIREPLSDALDTIEERRTMEIREQVNVMAGKMTVVLVACFFPALLIFIVGPAFVSISNALGSMGGS